MVEENNPGAWVFDAMNERLDFAVRLVKEVAEKNKLDLNDKEIIENARSIAVSMFIQKMQSRK